MPQHENYSLNPRDEIQRAIPEIAYVRYEYRITQATWQQRLTAIIATFDTKQ